MSQDERNSVKRKPDDDGEYKEPKRVKLDYFTTCVLYEAYENIPKHMDEVILQGTRVQTRTIRNICANNECWTETPHNRLCMTCRKQFWWCSKCQDKLLTNLCFTCSPICTGCKLADNGHKHCSTCPFIFSVISGVLYTKTPSCDQSSDIQFINELTRDQCIKCLLDSHRAIKLKAIAKYVTSSSDLVQLIYDYLYLARACTHAKNLCI